MKVEKRNGKQVSFDENKIYRAVLLASKSVPEEKRLKEEDALKIVEYVKSSLNKAKDEVVSIEKIQDLVENGLQKYNHFEIAKSYILYRNEAEKERFKRSKFAKDIESKLSAKNVQNQNANVDEYSFGGRKGEADSVLMKKLALDYYISPKFVKNHNDNKVYIHDLDSYVVGMHNCLSIPFDDILSKGFKTRQVDIRPAGSVSSAMQLIAVVFQIQSLQQFGGVSATHLDWTMVPFIRKSFYKHFVDGLKFVEGYSDKKCDKILKKLLEEDKK